MFSPKRLACYLAGALLLALYLCSLNKVGVLDPDEPRYAAIGQEMWRSRDFVTPSLWGKPWFEKPPFLYWLAATGNALHLGGEWRQRLPVALLSLLFLGGSILLLRPLFGVRTAVASTFLLGTCAGWIAYSGLGLTDMPMSIFFVAAVYLILPLIPEETRAADDSVGQGGEVTLRFLAAGVLLGLAVLAKGLVPLALGLPAFWFLRRHWRRWWIIAAASAVVSMPWYVAVYRVYGNAFVQEFFIRHHLQRLYSDSLQHVQPPWYYGPVIAGALFPWTPLLFLLGRRDWKWSARRLFLLSLVLWGLLFFSISRNKLPGYILPLLPFCFVLTATALPERLEFLPRWTWWSCAALVATIPWLGPAVSLTVESGKAAAATATAGSALWVAALLSVVVLSLGLFAPAVVRSVLLFSCTALCGIYLRATLYPELERTASARSLWRETAPMADHLCQSWVNRTWLYGLEYYRGSEIPACDQGNFRYALDGVGKRRPVLVDRHSH